MNKAKLTKEDWNNAIDHLREYKSLYASIPEGNLALHMFIIPFENRYMNGERTKELYEEMINIE